MVLTKAETEIDLPLLGIESVKFRTAVTGARILEISGSRGTTQADQLANKLRDVLDGLAVITRPTKCVDLRITGLDDSVTKDKIMVAIVKAGGCPEDMLKVGEVRSGPGGLGACIVKCPVTAAKTLLESGKGRLLMGWCSALVKTLEARPMRCFRCMGVGHTRPRCPVSVDRTSTCFRCSHEGHKSAGCSADPKCAVCTDAGKPSGHVMGSRNCNPPPLKSGLVPKTQSTQNAKSHHALEEELDMSE
jgi:hypothetical protein